MANKIKVKPLSDDSVKVNNKVVYKSQNDNWIACSELSVREQEAFGLYKITVIDKVGFPKGELIYKY